MMAGYLAFSTSSGSSIFGMTQLRRRDALCFAFRRNAMPSVTMMAEEKSKNPLSGLGGMYLTFFFKYQVILRRFESYSCMQGILKIFTLRSIFLFDQ